MIACCEGNAEAESLASLAELLLGAGGSLDVQLTAQLEGVPRVDNTAHTITLIPGSVRSLQASPLWHCDSAVLPSVMALGWLQHIVLPSLVV